jgi:uncharacterized membrane protein YedE/YeeE
MKFKLGALVAGLLFGAGVAISGLSQPSKVFGFLDVSGAFDASLLFAMVGGIAVLWVAQRIARRVRAPLFAERFPIYDRTHLDGRLVGGAAIFGVGWALAGICPGPALASFAFGVRAALLFVPAMAAGMLAFAAWGRRSSPERRQNAAADHTLAQVSDGGVGS